MLLGFLQDQEELPFKWDPNMDFGFSFWFPFKSTTRGGILLHQLQKDIHRHVLTRQAMLSKVLDLTLLEAGHGTKGVAPLKKSIVLSPRKVTGWKYGPLGCPSLCSLSKPLHVPHFGSVDHGTCVLFLVSQKSGDPHVCGTIGGIVAGTEPFHQHVCSFPPPPWHEPARLQVVSLFSAAISGRTPV